MVKQNTLKAKVEKWQGELDRLKITWRWGETRRFQSNSRKIARRSWLIEHISDAKSKLGKSPGGLTIKTG